MLQGDFTRVRVAAIALAVAFGTLGCAAFAAEGTGHASRKPRERGTAHAALHPHAHRTNQVIGPARGMQKEPPRIALRNDDREHCYGALVSAGVAFERVDPLSAMGVDEPTRLKGPIGGIEVTSRDGDERHAILDCRLALSLLSWSPALRHAGVTRIEHYSMYRAGAHVGGGPRVSGHAHGLAIDAARFYLADGSVLDVLTDWEERERNAQPCPVRPEEAWPSRTLRGLVCDAVAQNLFQVVITPHHDRAHENHVHLERKPEVSWTYIR